MAPRAIALIQQFFMGSKNWRIPIHLLNYALALLLVAVASGASLLFNPLLKDTPSAVFFIAVMVSAWSGGLSSGLLTAVFSTIVLNYFFLGVDDPRNYTFLEPVVHLGLFSIGAILISALNTAWRSEKQLVMREGEYRLRMLANNIPSIVWTAAPDGTITWVSDNWYTYTGLTPQQNARGWPQILHPDDLDRCVTQWHKALEQGLEYSIEVRNQRHDGQYRWFLTQAVPLRDQKGSITGWFGSTTDIHEHKLTQLRDRFINELDLRLRHVSDAQTIMQEAVMSLGQYLEADRCTFAEVDQQKDLLIVDSDWCQGIPSAAGTYVLSTLATPELRSAFASGHPVVVQNAETDPLTATASSKYEPFQIKAFLSIPCIYQGQWVALLSVNSKMPRVWREDEIALLQEATARLWPLVEQTRVTQALRQREALYRALTELSPQLVFMTRPDGDITYCNQWGLEFIGGKFEVLQGHGWAQYVHPDYREPIYTAWLTAIREKTDYELEVPLHRADGVYRWFYTRALPVTDSTGVVAYWLGVAIDITERKQAEVALKQSEDRLRMAMDSAQIGTWDWNLTTNELSWDANCKAMFGLSAEDDSSIEVFYRGLHPDDRDRLREIVEWSLTPSSGGRYDAEYRTIGIDDGIERWIAAKGQAYFNPARQPVRFIGTVLNITDRKRVAAERERLLQREKAAREEAECANRIKDEFLAVLSHELRSPLNPILGWTKLLQSRKFDAEKTAQALATIERNAKLQAELIEDLLDVSRILQGKMVLNMGPVNLATTIEAAIETVRLAAEAKAIQIHTALDRQIGVVTGDSARLQQIIWNLLANAVKFTPSGGRIEVRLAMGVDGIMRERGEANASFYSPTLSPSHYARITVTDTGKGINPEFLPHVFEYFRQEDGATTRKFGGLGLGLALVRHLTEQHGGTVRVESAGEGKGTTFIIHLPLQVVSSETVQEQLPATQSTNLSHIKILIVDDEVDMRDLMVNILKGYNAQVQAAASATEALTILEQWQPDLFISDIGMPEVDGYMLMQQVRSREALQSNSHFPDRKRVIPAIALTAYAGETNQQQALSAGFQYHLAKPVEPDRLVEVISQVLGRV